MDNLKENVIQFPEGQSAKALAAQWLLRLEQGELSVREKKQLSAWVNSEPGNKALILEMASMWGKLDEVRVLADLFPLPLKPDQQSSRAHTLSPARKLSYFAVAASLLVLFATWLFVLPEFGNDGLQPKETIYVTDIGEQARVQLDDGSIAELNTGSRLKVAFTENQRSVYLEQGEGFFKVAKNPQRPFVVYAGSGAIEAVGTAFNVRLLQDNKVDVMLSEGIVEVQTVTLEQDSFSGDEEVNLPTKATISTVGQKVSYSQSIEELTQIDPELLERKLAWRDGKWMFKGESLTDVLAEVSRYTDTNILIKDDSIRNLQVAGYFDLGQINPFMNALQSGLNLRIVHAGDGSIEIYAGNETSDGQDSASL